ncbi:MAG: hypothetical protein NC177_16135 [Ruminococcus flavefaciens]|nr:hypothetical protein [Ruminococcus flavefaciens]
MFENENMIAALECYNDNIVNTDPQCRENLQKAERLYHILRSAVQEYGLPAEINDKLSDFMDLFTEREVFITSALSQSLCKADFSPCIWTHLEHELTPKAYLQLQLIHKNLEKLFPRP